ncbi:MAG: hypothetical protein V7L02_09650, partial [Nostoc sp.]|uniref:hypothetical protein n=1 Tax=Nostoc sp. TaxID=1180 RepID=UPI002FFA0B19
TNFSNPLWVRHFFIVQKYYRERSHCASCVSPVSISESKNSAINLITVTVLLKREYKAASIRYNFRSNYCCKTC